MQIRKIFANHIIASGLGTGSISSSTQSADAALTVNQGREKRAMRRLLGQLALVTIVMAVLLGGFVVTPSYGQATTDRGRIVESSLITIQFFDCGTAGVVQLSGNLLFTFNSVLTPAGSVTTVSRVQSQHLTGTTSSGDRAMYIEGDTLLSRFGTNTDEFTHISHGTLVINGKGIDVEFTALFHLVGSSNGEPIVVVDQISGRCR
jgi:hypothetical protein